MAIKIHTKKLLRRILWAVGCIAILCILIAAMQKVDNALCKDVKVTIKGNKEQLFITEKGILTQINAADFIQKKTIKEINIKALEKQLKQNIWIENVEIYFTKQNIVQIDVTQREPLFRLFAKNGNSFYVDQNNYVLPLSDEYSAKLPLFTSFSNNKRWSLNDSTTLQSIQKMAAFITENPFWMAQIQQVDIRANDAFELVPTIGNHIIVFGDTTDMVAKFQKLEKFYKKVSAVVGFDKYAVLNVQFKNQIVASNKYNESIDSAQAENLIQQFLLNNVDSSLTIVDTTRNRNRIQSDTARQRNNARAVPTTRSTTTTRATQPVASPTTSTTTTRPSTNTLPRPAATRSNSNRPSNNTPVRTPPRQITRPPIRPTNNRQQH
jgi:cell division protein FtsQ